MKLLGLFLALTSASALADGASSFASFIRQTQQGSGVVWDMPVATTGSASSSLLLENRGALFQLWTINQNTGTDYLLDQKLVGAYLPVADVKITTLDPYPLAKRTRVDQPFTVEINVDGLLTGAGLPLAATKVMLEQHIQNYAAGQTSLDAAAVAANPPLATAYIAQNGKTSLKFPASSLEAADPTLARGEEHFIIHALSDGTITQTQIASAKVQVWPVASGEIIGIEPDKEYRSAMPVVQLKLTDLYPSSDTSFMLYEGTQINGVTGTLVKGFTWTSSIPKSTTLESDELDALFTKDGTYTVALMSETVFGTELLCPPITFSVKRTLAVNALQVNFSDGTQP